MVLWKMIHSKPNKLSEALYKCSTNCKSDLELGEVGDVGAAAHVIIDVPDLNDSHGALVALRETPGACLEYQSFLPNCGQQYLVW